MKIAALAGALTVAALVAWRVVACSGAPQVEVAFVATGDREYPYAARGTSCGCDMLLLRSRSDFEMRLRPGGAPGLTAATANGTTVSIQAAILADARRGWYEVEIVRQRRVLTHTRHTVDVGQASVPPPTKGAG